MGSSAPDMPDGWDVVVLIGYLWANTGWRHVAGGPERLPAAVQPGAGPGCSKYSCDGAPKQATTLQSHCGVSSVSLKKPYLIRENSATSRSRPRRLAKGPPRALGGTKRRGTDVGRWFCTVTPMLVSYVVRLHTDHVGEEEFAGQVEAVAVWPQMRHHVAARPDGVRPRDHRDRDVGDPRSPCRVHEG